MTTQTITCAGTGRRWMSGMGRAVCPACKVSSATLGVTKRHDQAAARRLIRNPAALVPVHVHAATRAPQ